MRVEAHGIAADLPDGWEGAIRVEPRERLGRAGVAGAEAFAVAHLATFALPAQRGDFGSAAVETMRDDDDFVAVVEFGPDEVDTALFAERDLPRRIDPDELSPRQLQRPLRNQVGVQRFCTVTGRALCVYVVLGDGRDRARHLRRVEAVLDRLHVEPAR